MPNTALENLLVRAEGLLDKLDHFLPASVPPVEWDAAIAFRWRRRNGRGELLAVRHPHQISLKDLHGVDAQKQRIENNTRQFVAGRPANNALLTGARGTGKSSLVKAVLNRFAKQGLRLIEIDKHDLLDLPEIVDLIYGRPERFILFCDDLSFDEGEPGYQALKAALDGSIAAPSENLLIYATSNRRHLMPEYLAENLDARNIDGEVHPGEAIEEKVSLSDRFGLWLSFYPFSQDEYLTIAARWLKKLGVSDTESEEVRRAALQWALSRGSRSGRTAWQFARDWAGSH